MVFFGFAVAFSRLEAHGFPLEHHARSRSAPVSHRKTRSFPSNRGVEQAPGAVEAISELRIGLGTTDRNFVTIPGSFLVLFFLLIDGYSIDVEWFRPGKAGKAPKRDQKLVFFKTVGVFWVSFGRRSYAFKAKRGCRPRDFGARISWLP